MPKYKNFIGFGIAGNFALHLAQAGELEDFKDIITADEAAPKGMFPFYLPRPMHATEGTYLHAKKILSTYPLSSDLIRHPQVGFKIQAEPEVGLVCEFIYVSGKLSEIKPTYFGAYNDCSIRIAGASKISEKKNWGEYSKGFSNELIAIDTFSEGGIMDNYSLCSFLRRDNALTQYGENVTLLGYSYFYEKLTDWMCRQITIQEDFGPLEPLEEYLMACNNPAHAIISIGATRYTTYGEETFLAVGDEIIVVAYNHNELPFETMQEMIQNKNYTDKNFSVLAQKVI